MPQVLGLSSTDGKLTKSINVVAVAVLLVCTALGAAGWAATDNLIPLVAMVVVGLILMQSPRIAEQWERAVVLRLGRFAGLRGPGLFWIVPFVDRVSSWIDQRTVTTTFAAEQTLTSDAVPVNVDAVLFWMIPSSAVESMGMGGLMGAAALRQANLTGGSATPPTADGNQE